MFSPSKRCAKQNWILRWSNFEKSALKSTPPPSKLKQEMHEKQIFLKKDKQMKTYILDGILRRRRRSQGERQRDRGSRPLTMSGVWVINSRDSKAMRWLMIRVSSETKPQLYSKASPKIPLSLFWHLLTLFTF